MVQVDERLITKAVEGDTTALRDLLKQYGPQVRQRLGGKIGRKYQAVLDEDDVLQVTYLEAFLTIDRFTPDGPDSFLPWLTRIAENNLRDAIKGMERAKRPPRAKQIAPVALEDSYVDFMEVLGSTGTTPSRQVARAEVKTILDALIDRLPTDYGAVVRRYDLQGESVAQIAESMGRSTAAVHMLRARAQDRLREWLGSSQNYFSDCS